MKQLPFGQRSAVAVRHVVLIAVITGIAVAASFAEDSGSEAAGSTPITAASAGEYWASCPSVIAENECGQCEYPTCTILAHLAGGDSCRQLWVNAEYLLWWAKGLRVPNQLPVSNAMPYGIPLALEQATSEIDSDLVTGASSVNSDARSGVRVRGGYWLSEMQASSLEFDYLFVAYTSTRYEDQGSFPVPVPVPLDGRQAVEFYEPPYIEDPDLDLDLPVANSIIAGSIDTAAETELHSSGLLYRHTFAESNLDGDWVVIPGTYRLDFLFGYRFYHLDDRVEFSETRTREEQTIFQATQRIKTRNDFHGIDVGFTTQFRRNRITLDLLMKLALGTSIANTSARYATINETAMEPVGFQVGTSLLLNGATTSHSESDFATVADVGVTLGYDITDYLRATFGYSLIYWSRVARPGTQLRSIVLTSGLVEDTASPSDSMITTDFWAQGMNFGLVYQF